MNKQTNEIYLYLASKADTGIRISDSLTISENSLRFTVYKQCPNTVQQLSSYPHSSPLYASIWYSVVK